MPKEIKYFVYRYKYSKQPTPLWDAIPASWGSECLPRCILSEPGICIIYASTKSEAIGIVRSKFSLN